ncbi:la-related protein 6-like [Stegodyphus dumicola]|uniref:la-related protein 6-like n=1 Tax=Stegodyphus dumicola TaxID=202533 RepID=UPI0015AC8F46|nr:la-related protein 6-like [Stegodyphus dumicola]
MEGENVQESQLKSEVDGLQGDIIALELSDVADNENTNVCKKDEAKISQDVQDKHVESESFELPSEALAEKIIRQAEFYFSDFNIIKNSFLLKHIRRNKEGFVSLKLVASFRKVKSLSKDWRVVAYCLEKSKILELNEEKTKIRRIEPIPKLEDTSFGKTVVIFNLPFQDPSSEGLKELFSKFGTVVYAGILTTGSDKCNVYHKRCLSFHREIASTTFGVVEFDKYQEAQNSIKDEDGHLPKENKMKVVPLLVQIYRSKSRNFRFKTYPQHLRRGYGRYESKNFRREIPISDDGNEKNRSSATENILNEESNFKKGYFRRSNRWKKGFQGSGQTTIQGKFGYPGEGRGPNSSLQVQNRQLKTNNSMNIQRSVIATRNPKGPDRSTGFLETRVEV